MPDIIELNTQRLKLRQWQATDRPPFARLNADPIVMEHFPALLTEAESNAMAEKIETLIASHGWGMWAVELVGEKQFIGFVGLHEVHPELPFAPAVEIGWRLAKEYWGKGYATEAAREVLRYAFEQLDLAEVCSFTAVTNLRSQALMQRLNMINSGENFEHPRVPEGHVLREHVLYKLGQVQWFSNSL